VRFWLLYLLLMHIVSNTIMYKYRRNNPCYYYHVSFSMNKTPRAGSGKSLSNITERSQQQLSAAGSNLLGHIIISSYTRSSCHHTSGNRKCSHQCPNLQPLRHPVGQSVLHARQLVDDVPHHCIRQVQLRHQRTQLCRDVHQRVAIVLHSLNNNNNNNRNHKIVLMCWLQTIAKAFLPSLPVRDCCGPC
jgi:hypothetical protein